MRRHWVSFLLCTIACVPSWSQDADTSLVRQYLAESDRMVQLHQYKGAVQYQLKALDLSQSAPQPDYVMLVDLYGNIGRLYRQAGVYDSSFVYLRRGVRIGNRHLPKEDPALLRIYNSLGIYYFFQGNCQEALQNYKIVLEGYMRQGGQDLEVANVYNNMALCYEQLDDYDQALTYYRRTFSIRYEILGAGHPLVADCYLNLGNCYYLLGDYDQSLDFYDYALSIWEETLEPEDPDFASLYNNMGVCYQSKGDYQRAEALLERALEQNIRVMGPDHPEVANAYNNLGLNFFDNGDYNRALVYYQRALAIRLRHFGEQHHKVASLYNNIGNCYRKKKDYNRAYGFCRRALNIRLERFGENHREVADSYNDLGLYCEETRDYPSAIAFYKSALDINLERLGDQHPAVADSYERTGRVYALQTDFPKAIRYFERALTIKLAALDSDHPEIAVLRNQIAGCLPDQPEKALAYCEEALVELDKNASNLSLIALLRILGTRGKIQLDQFIRSGKADWLYHSDATFLEARSVIADIQKGFQEPSSKQILFDNFFEVFENSLEVKYLLLQLTGQKSYLQEAFGISEDSKNVLLQEAIQKVRADRFAGLPDSLYQKERDLQIDLAFYEQLRFNEENKGEKRNPSRLADIRNHIFELKRAYYGLINILESNYPEYFSLRYGQADLDLEKLQTEVLGPGHSLLEYFVGDENLYLFLVSDDQAEMIRIRPGIPLGDAVRTLREAIFSYDPVRQPDTLAVQTYVQAAYQLYRMLLVPILPLLKDSILTIVPDGPLGYLPFECLITEVSSNRTSWKALPYLIRDYQISYSFAASLLDESGPKAKSLPSGNLLAFAPSFGGEAGFPPLRYNQIEVASIAALLDGKVFTGEAATEANFLENAGRYRILHLATHAQANDTIGAFSYLAFYPLNDSIENERLFVKDLYNMELGADLVVLSACETGIGEWQRGEGIVSLGRGFLFAGAKSIVTTLWSIDDKPTAQIMTAFYERLLAGQTKDAALRQAKLDYLDSNSAIRGHPLFWAAQIPLGNMEAMTIQTRRPWHRWWWLLLIPTGFLGYWWLARKPRSKTPGAP